MLKMKQPQTQEQEWARARNWSKRRLRSIVATLKEFSKSKVLTHSERDHIKRLLPKAIVFLAAWDNNNEISKEEYCQE